MALPSRTPANHGGFRRHVKRRCRDRSAGRGDRSVSRVDDAGGPANRQHSRGADGPPCAGVRAASRVADAGRGDGRGAAPARVGPARTSLRVEARPADGPAARAVCHPAARARGRGLIARSCTESTRSRAGAIAPISSRTRWACASTSWSSSSTCTPGRGSCSRRMKEQEWSEPQSASGPVLGPDPAADGRSATGWIASSGRATSSPPRRGRRGSRRRSSGSARARTASRRLKNSYCGQAGPAARAGRRPAQGRCPAGAQRVSA